MTPIASLPPLELPVDLAGRILTPALVVARARARRNIGAVLTATQGPDRWRPHVKTVKIPAVLSELVAAGLRHFKCATVREAEVLLEAAAAATRDPLDVLLAHPLTSPTRLAAIAAAHPGARLSYLVEDVASARAVPAGLEVFVDVNPGMDRTGIPESRTEAIIATARAAGERFRGVHYYDGHLADGDPASRAARACAGYDRLLDLEARLRASAAPCGELITSGTPTFLHALAHAGLAALDGVIHRVSPGTVIYHDARSAHELPELSRLGLEPAALLLARVVSHPTRTRVTCDAGSKSIAAEAGDPCADIVNDVGSLTARTPSEEHLPLDIDSGAGPPRGTILQLVPRHVCPTVNLAEEAVLLEDDGTWSIADVAARGHAIR
ncbi:MAG: alanine racemase [Planctomycetota bacterium]|jgi:D-serine deaminase-like pyridoxal phosphate-dependent protein